MGKQTIQKVEVVAVCDRCGAEGDTGNEQGRNKWGELNITYKGHTGGRTWAGDAAGGNIEGSKWLCLDCTEKFLDFMNKGKV